MGRVVISRVDDSAVSEFPRLAGMTAEGSIATRSVVGGDDRPLFLWTHDLAPGARLRWDSPPVGHLTYVWEGEVEVAGTTLGSKGVVIVEPNAPAGGLNSRGGAKLLHFHRPDAHPKRPVKSGGNVHVIDRNGIFQGDYSDVGTSHILWADSGCPTCEMWLHESYNPKPHPQRNPHFHSADEIIFILEGGMVIGRRTLDAGTALAVDADTIYSFGRGEKGLAFINFRASKSMYVEVIPPKNEPRFAPKDETQLIRETMKGGSVNLFVNAE